MIRNILMTLGAITISMHGYAQLLQGSDNNVKTAQSTQLQKSPSGVDLVSTDFYSGTSNVSIPIYNHAESELPLGISLGYTTKGVRVDQIASSVGLGWDINGISYIEREVNGLEDEVIIRDANGVVKDKGDWQCDGCQILGQGVEENKDVFVANLAGRTVRFSISLNGNTCWNCDPTFELSTYPKSEIKVELFLDNVPILKGINFWGTNPTVHQYHKFTFKITDENGNVYYFNSADKQTAKTTTIENQTYSYSPINRWWVSKIVTYEGKEITYDYLQLTTAYPLYKDEQIMEQSETYSDCGNNNIFSASSVYPVVSRNEMVEWSGQVCAINQIKYPDGTELNFEYRNDTRLDVPDLKILKNIKIKKGYSGLENEIIYSLGQWYSYALGTNQTNSYQVLSTNLITDSKNLRLVLTNIQRGLNNGPSRNIYSFHYNSTLLPARLSPKQDYYGYFNNHSPTVLSSNSYSYAPNVGGPVDFSVPLHYYTVPGPSIVSYGVDKTPDFNSLKAQVLTKVTTEMAGEFEIFYDAHQLATNNLYTSPTGVVGTNTYDGLRTQKIEFRDFYNADNNYRYEYSYSGGELFNKTLYHWVPTVVLEYLTFPPAIDYQHTAPVVQKKWFNSYVNQTAFFEGFNHGYSEITESKYGYNNELLGKTKYKFTNLTRQTDEPVINESDWPLGDLRFKDYKYSHFLHVVPSELLCYQMGLLKETQHFIASSTSPFKIVKNEYEKSIVDYNNMPTNGTKFPHFISVNRNVMGVNGYCRPEYSNFQIFTSRVFRNSKYRLKTTTTTHYSGTTDMIEEVNYEYDNRDNVKNVKWKDSKGDDYFKRYTYHYDNYPWSPYQLLEAEALVKGNGSSSDIALSYSYKGTGSALPLINDALYSMKGMKLYSQRNATADMQVFLRDAKQNAVDVILAEGTRKVTSLWDYKLRGKVAEVTNAQFSDISYSSFEGLTNTNADNFEKGNWNIDVSKVKVANTAISDKAVTGKYIYELAGHTITTNQNFFGNKQYYLSLWADEPPVVTFNNTTVTMNSVVTIGRWTLYDTYITWPTIINPNAPLTIGMPTIISAGHGYIDELRLRPANTVMTTYTYEPLLGISSTCDNRNNIIYTEYDEHGRAWRTKDIDGNILSQTDYTIQGVH